MNRQKAWILALLLAALLAAATGCGNVNALEPDATDVGAVQTGAPETGVAEAEAVETEAEIPVDLEIREKMFLTQTNEVYVNAADYLGKTIKYEGIFDGYTYGPDNLPFWMVMRYGPGCCGDDGTVGFEVWWDDESIERPARGDWVEVIGKLVKYNEDGATYLRLDVLSLTKLETRGKETVLQ